MKSGQSNEKKPAKQMEKGLGLYVSPISRFPDFLQGHCERSENDKPHQRLWLNIYENLAKQLEKHGEWH